MIVDKPEHEATTAIIIGKESVVCTFFAGEFGSYFEINPLDRLNV